MSNTGSNLDRLTKYLLSVQDFVTREDMVKNTNIHIANLSAYLLALESKYGIDRIREGRIIKYKIHKQERTLDSEKTKYTFKLSPEYFKEILSMAKIYLKNCKTLSDKRKDIQKIITEILENEFRNEQLAP